MLLFLEETIFSLLAKPNTDLMPMQFALRMDASQEDISWNKVTICWKPCKSIKLGNK